MWTLTFRPLLRGADILSSPLSDNTQNDRMASVNFLFRLEIFKK